MKLVKRNIPVIVIGGVLLLAGCASTNHMEVADKTKPGFSNITDVPLPQVAVVDTSKSLVTGTGNTWTGHLVYGINKQQNEVVDYMSAQMQDFGWTKLSELRGNESVLTFINGKRIATVRVAPSEGYFTRKTAVAIDVTTSTMKAEFQPLTEVDKLVEVAKES